MNRARATVPLTDCAMANVVMLMFPDQVVWLDPLTDNVDYAVPRGVTPPALQSGSRAALVQHDRRFYPHEV